MRGGGGFFTFVKNEHFFEFLSEIAFFMIYHKCPFFGPGWGPDFLTLNRRQLNEILFACSS